MQRKTHQQYNVRIEVVFLLLVLILRLFVDTFVIVLLLGIFVGAVQRLSRTAQSGDEFVTAMRMAEQANIPIVLGDAPQNDTLASIKKVFSPATIDPLEARQGAESLLFSAFGVLLPGRVPPAVAKVCVKNKPFHEHINSLRLWPLSITVCPACLLTCLL